MERNFKSNTKTFRIDQELIDYIKRFAYRKQIESTKASKEIARILRNIEIKEKVFFKELRF